MFSTKHIIILVICVGFIVAASILLRKFKVSLKFVLRMLLVIGIVSETLKLFTYILANEDELHGYLPKTDLPFHLCSIQLIFIVILNIAESPKVKRVLCAFMYPTCLIGGILALLLPTSSSLDMWMITIQYYLYHSAIIIYAIYLMKNDEVSFTFKDYLVTMAMLYGIFLTAMYLNSWINDYVSNINFMYVINPPMDGLPYLTKEYGWLVYIVHYMLLGFFIVTLCFIKPIIRKIRGTDGTQKEVPTSSEAPSL